MWNQFSCITPRMPKISWFNGCIGAEDETLNPVENRIRVFKDTSREKGNKAGIFNFPPQFLNLLIHFIFLFIKNLKSSITLFLISQGF
jgi:hypothetical protein